MERRSTAPGMVGLFFRLALVVAAVVLIATMLWGMPGSDKPQQTLPPPVQTTAPEEPPVQTTAPATTAETAAETTAETTVPETTAETTISTEA